MISLILMILAYDYCYFAKFSLGRLEVHLCTVRSRLVSRYFLVVFDVFGVERAEV